jgi:integrase
MSKIINILEKQKNDYYKNDIWDLTKHPDKQIAEFFSRKLYKYRSLNFAKVSSNTKKQQLKAYFMALFEGGISITYKVKNMVSYFSLLDLANWFSDESFLDVTVDDLRELFKEVIYINKVDKEAYKIIPNFYIDLIEVLDERTGFERDLWHLDKLKINKERINAANPFKSINFRNITNEVNRDYVKLWARYLIGCTELAVSTIVNQIYNVTTLLNEFEDIDASNITEDDITPVVNDWRESKSVDKLNRILKHTNMFYKYFEVREESRIKSPIKEKHFLKDNYIPADNLVDDFVLEQINRKIHLLPLQEQVMFLINYRHGLRISDLCNIKSKDCVYKDSTGMYHLKFFCQKMQNVQDILICEALYKMIKKQQEKVINKSNWLFPSPKTYSHPMMTGTFSKRINRWIKACGIKNSDGTDFKYKSHAFRHTVATTLYQDYNVPLFVIQKCVLHHKEQQMTLTYTQRTDDFRKKQHDIYINKAGATQSIDYLSSNDLTKRALSNGFCGNPTMLSVCPMADSCLTCEYFRTSKEFLDIHKKHLAEVEKNIIFYEEKGFIPNLETAKETKIILLKIIESLEKIE